MIKGTKILTETDTDTFFYYTDFLVQEGCNGICGKYETKKERERQTDRILFSP